MRTQRSPTTCAMTPSPHVDLSFYHVLHTIVGDEAVVCPKVSLGDLFYAATGDYGRFSASKTAAG